MKKAPNPTEPTFTYTPPSDPGQARVLSATAAPSPAEND